MKYKLIIMRLAVKMIEILSHYYDKSKLWDLIILSFNVIIMIYQSIYFYFLCGENGLHT